MIGELSALAASACWAIGSQLFGRIGRRGAVPADAMNLAKCVSAAALFAVTGLALRGTLWPALPARVMGWLVASGVVGLAIGDGAYFRTMNALGARRALLLLSTAPVFAAIGGAIWLDEPMRGLDTLAILAVTVGVALVVQEQGGSPSPGPSLRAGKGDRRSAGETAAASSPPLPAGGEGPGEGSPKRPLVLGVLFGVLSAVCQAAGSLMSRAAMASGTGALETALVRLPAGVAGIAVLALLTGRARPIARTLARPGLFVAIGASAAVGSYAGIWLAQLGLEHARSTAVASTLLATSPVFALPLGRWLDAERITARALTGTLVACLGIAALTLGRK